LIIIILFIHFIFYFFKNAGLQLLNGQYCVTYNVIRKRYLNFV